MKTRNGFVSNSSSSSFVVLLPNKSKDELIAEFVTNNKFVTENICNNYNTTQKNIAEAMRELIKNKVLFQGESSFLHDALSEIFEEKGVIIASVEHGPDEGQIVIVDHKKIKKIIGTE